MTTLTKSTGTVTLSGAVEKVRLPAVYGWVWVKNMSDGDMFLGLSDGVSAGADGVLAIPAGECGRVQTDGQDSVYLMGSGNALVVAQNYADCPFKVGGKGGEIPDLSAYAKKTDIPNIKVNAAVNADTVDGLHTSDFTQIIELGDNQTDTKNAIGLWGKTTIYRCANWTDFPAECPDEQGIVISMSYAGTGTAGTDKMWVTQFFIPANSGVVYKRHIANTTVYSWCAMYSADNKPYITGSFSGTSYSTGALDTIPSFAICGDGGTMKIGNIYQISSQVDIKFAVSFENLSDTTHEYIIFK